MIAPYYDPVENVYHLGNGKILKNIHPISQCEIREGFCPMHTPSDHHMREWSAFWRYDIGVLERICPHGIGHPDPDALEYHRWQTGKQNPWQASHGCDGCCQA